MRVSGFHDRLAAAWSSSGSMLCVGLDPDPTRFPAPLDGAPDALLRFCTAIVDATADVVCAFKPQFAHFAALRAEPELEAICTYVRERPGRDPDPRRQARRHRIDGRQYAPKRSGGTARTR